MQYPGRSSDRLSPAAPRLTLAELREKMGALARIDPLPGWAIPKTDLVLPRGSLVELLGTRSREWLMELFAKHADTRIAWIEPKLTLFPPAVEQRGVSLKRWLFIETKEEWNWSVLQVFRSKLFHFAVTSVDLIPARGSDAYLRKLQIQAERSGTALFLLSESETRLFGITHRLRIDAEDAVPQILKRKRG
jgi:hypothetical protein